MTMLENDTIAAVCTGVGGAISIVRISGPQAYSTLMSLWKGSADPKQAPREMLYGRLEGGEGVLAVYMPQPRSYTGEDVVEIQCHGGMLNTRKVLRAVLESTDVRSAEAGEFTLRAFMNGKMDLTQAEAIADLIHAQSEMARTTAEYQLAGSLKEKITHIRSLLSHALAECESRLDFPEDVLGGVDTQSLISLFHDSVFALNQMLQTRQEGMILREGVRIAIVGKPNVGKSSLLNYLLGYERAIVSNIAGTTRDSLEELAHIRGIPVRLFDTAGLRKTDDIIEQLGVERSLSIRQQSDIVFHLIDPDDLDSHIEQSSNTLVVMNKSDLVHDKIPSSVVPISVKNGTGFERLFDEFESLVWQFSHQEAPEIAINERQSALLNTAKEALEHLPIILENCSDDGEVYELACIHLRDAITALGGMTGETVDPDILDTIFSQFCIGK